MTIKIERIIDILSPKMIITTLSGTIIYNNSNLNNKYIKDRCNDKLINLNIMSDEDYHIYYYKIINIETNKIISTNIFMAFYPDENINEKNKIYNFELNKDTYCNIILMKFNISSMDIIVDLHEHHEVMFLRLKEDNFLINDIDFIFLLFKYNSHTREYNIANIINHIKLHIDFDTIIIKLFDINNHLYKYIPTKLLTKEIIITHIKEYTCISKIQYLPSIWKYDKDIVLRSVKSCSFSFRHVPDMYKNDKDIILAAVNNHGYNLEFASEYYKNDKEIVLAAILSYGGALKYASDFFKNDKEIILIALKDDSMALEYVSDKYKNNKEIVKFAISGRGSALKFASQDCKNDEEIILLAIRNHQYGNPFKYASDILKNNKDFINKAIEINGYVLDHVNHKYITEENMMIAIRMNADLILHKPFYYHIKNIKKMIKINPYLIKYMKCIIPYNYKKKVWNIIKFKYNKKIILESVIKSGMVLKYIPKKYRYNKQIVKAAIKSNNLAFYYVPRKLQNDRNILDLAIKNNADELLYYSKRKINLLEYKPIDLYKKVHKKTKRYSYKIQNNKKLVLAAIKIRKDYIVYATKRVRDKIIKKNIITV